MFCLVNYLLPSWEVSESWEVRVWQLSAPLFFFFFFGDCVGLRVWEGVKEEVSPTALQDLSYVTACRHDGFAVVQAAGDVHTRADTQTCSQVSSIVAPLLLSLSVEFL